MYNDEPDVSMQIGQELYIRVRNNTLSDIPNGSVVRINGSHGNAAPTIVLASADSEENSQVAGLATHTIASNSFGYISTFGLVRGVDTDGVMSDGDELFLSVTSGEYVNVDPGVPYYSISVGRVIVSHASNGVVFVNTTGKRKLAGGDLKSVTTLNQSGVPFVTYLADTNAGGVTTVSDFVYDSGNSALYVNNKQVITSGDNISLFTNDSNYATSSYVDSGDTAVSGWAQAYVDSQDHISNVVEDTTPQLGGDLDLNGNQILDAQCEASLSTNVALTAKGAASQSASFFEATDSSDTVVAKVYPTTDTSNFLLQKGAGDNVLITAKTVTPGTSGWAGVEIDSDGQAYLELDRGGTTNWADLALRTASATKWRVGLEANQSRFAIYDFTAGNYVLYAPDNGTDVTTDRTWHFNKAAKGALNTESDGSTVTFDLDEADTHTVTLGDNRILALSNADVGQRFVIRLVQDGTGSRTVTWFSTIKWPGNLVPTLTTTGGKTDVFGFICTAANTYDGFVIGYNL